MQTQNFPQTAERN